MILGWVLSGFVRICQGLSGFARTCQDLSGFVKICQDLPAVVRICHDFFYWIFQKNNALRLGD